MLGEAELTAALQQLLVADDPEEGEIVVVRRGLRRRSTIYFVGLKQGSASSVSWVVKRPTPEAERLGIRPPMTAAEQYAALGRLYSFLSDGRTPFAAPRPVALLPELDALVMEFVAGHSLWDLAVPSALYRPQPLREGVRRAALALRHLHTIEPADSEVVNAGDVEEAASQVSIEALRTVHRRVEDTWFPPGRNQELQAKVVLLHGDWAPENVLLDREQAFILDPELTDRGWPEHDLARFLLMLWDRPLFVASANISWPKTLRHQLTRIFLTAYYDGEHVSPLLRPLLRREVSQRWAVRHQEAQRGGSAAARARSMLLAHYFGALLRELADPRWAKGAVRRP